VRQVKYWVKNNAQLYETVYLEGTHLSEWNICLKNGQIWHLTWLEFAREFCQSGTNVQALGEIQFEEFSKCLYQESRWV